MRTAKIERKTTETQIAVEVNLDGTGTYNISTGIGFLDHMVEQLSRHSLIDINMSVQGDLHVDQHHTVEDSAIALGEALSQALGGREGITRYGAAETPMDEACTRVAIDLSNRPYLVWKVELTQKRMGEMDSELFKEWYYAIAQSLGATLHVECMYGANNHHIIEASYKGLARALRQAVEIDPRKEGAVPSTKGTLGGTL